MAKHIKVETAKPTICVQIIKTQWTKASRGGEGAVRRGRVPDALELPPVGPGSSLDGDRRPLLLHELSFSEPDFHYSHSRGTCSVGEIPPGLPVCFFDRNGIKLEINDDLLRAVYQWSPSLGAPKRQYPDATGTYIGQTQEALTLQPETWGRILYNGRHTDWDDGRWWYERWLFNIGLLSSPAPLVFVDTEPNQVFSKMADLW